MDLTPLLIARVEHQNLAGASRGALEINTRVRSRARSHGLIGAGLETRLSRPESNPGHSLLRRLADGLLALAVRWSERSAVS